MAVALNLNIIHGAEMGTALTAEAKEFSCTHRNAGYAIQVFDPQASHRLLPGSGLSKGNSFAFSLGRQCQ
jgi:hypothetical protein